MKLSPITVMCLWGYAITQRMICDMMAAPAWGPEAITGILLAGPLALYCHYLDNEGR